MCTEYGFGKMKRALEMEDGDGCTAACMSLTPLSCTLKNGKDGKFYVNAYFTTIKEKFKKRYKSNLKKKRGQALESDRPP